MGPYYGDGLAWVESRQASLDQDTLRLDEFLFLDLLFGQLDLLHTYGKGGGGRRGGIWQNILHFQKAL